MGKSPSLVGGQMEGYASRFKELCLRKKEDQNNTNNNRGDQLCSLNGKSAFCGMMHTA